MVRRRLPSFGSAIHAADLRDLLGGKAGDLGRLLERRLVRGERLVEVVGRCGDELLVDPALVGDLGQPAH